MGTPWAREAGWNSRDLLSAAEQGVIWNLTLYPKNVTDCIQAHVLKQVREEIEDA